MNPYPYVYRWNRMGRKGQRCRVTARGGMNSVCVEFEDGFRAVSSGNAVRKAKLDDYDAAKDGHDSYFAAVEAKRQRGDTHWPEKPQWRIVSPAPRSAVLELAGPRARARRLTLRQQRDVDTAAVFLGDMPMAVAYFGHHGWRRIEMALSISPAAARLTSMRKLVRMAQLTLLPMAETALVVANVHPANKAGQHMARLVGFRPARLREPVLWVYRKDRHERHSQSGQSCETGGRATEG